MMPISEKNSQFREIKNIQKKSSLFQEINFFFQICFYFAALIKFFFQINQKFFLFRRLNNFSRK